MRPAKSTPKRRGRPPTGHQFTSGQSGNPLGRPKGTPNTKTVVQKIANERHRIKIEGADRMLNAVELLVLILRQRSLQGSVKANKLLDRYRIRFAPEPARPPGFLATPEELTIAEWQERYSPKDDLPYGYGGEAKTPRF